MRPIQEQTILVTGATDGLGKALAAELASRGAMVLVHGRSERRLIDTLRELQERTADGKLATYLADFSSLDDVRRLAADVERDHERLDVLVNNAGIGGGSGDRHREESKDGYELRFAVNYLAPFLVTNLVLPLLERSAPARIVNVTSVGQAPIDFDDVMLAHGYEAFRAYRQSKLAQIMFTFELAGRLRASGEQGLTVNAVHPASLMPTKMVYETFGYTTSTIEDGVRATLRLVTSPELEGTSGRYFDQLREGRAHRQAYDAGARRRLWELSEELVGLGETRHGDSATPSAASRAESAS